MNSNFRNLLRKFYYWLPLSASSKNALKNAYHSKFPGSIVNSHSTPQAIGRAGRIKKSLRNLLRTAYLKFPISDYRKYQLVSTLFDFSPTLFNSLPEFQRWKALAGDSPRPWESLLKSPEGVIAPKEIRLPTSSTPRISVVIPVYGKVDYTLMCLRSIADCSIQVPFEVIVVDDCSPDNTLDALQGVSGVRVVSNQTNQGFIRSCNAGAAVALGEYLCFLNNDTQVCGGWLDELVRTYDDFSGVGLAGSKLVYPNGKLQEAGGIIWRNESAWNFGRGEDPSHPMFNYARETDYISGASILIQKKLFDELGGFDELYLPAYCEDADLALKVRSRGLKVMYQPLSVVVHYEGITSGTDINQGAKAYQVQNMHKMFERWHELLSSNEPAGGDVDRAKDRGSKYRVLVLDMWTPTPDRDAGSVIALNLMLILRQMGFQVTFIPTGNFSYLAGYTQNLQRAGIEVLYGPYCTTVKQHLKKSGNRYDLVLMFRPAIVNNYLSDVRKFCRQAKVLFHTQDLHFLRLTREAELFKDAAMQKVADEMKQMEFAAIRKVDASIVVSTAELELLSPELPGEKIYVLPLIMDVRGSDKSFSDRRNIVFVGGYQHPPNMDAVQFFVTAVMPLLRQRLQGVIFYAVGGNPPAEIQALASDDVVITGHVQDLNPMLDQMRISIAPLRYGAGIKGKIGMAMAVGLPTVATSLAAEGMPVKHDENILVADGAEGLADAVTRLYQDEALWNMLSRNGLEFAEKAWGGEAAWSTLHDILHDMGVSSLREKHPLKLYCSDVKQGNKQG